MGPLGPAATFCGGCGGGIGVGWVEVGAGDDLLVVATQPPPGSF